MAFEHTCLSDTEAENEMRRLLDAVPLPTLVLGRTRDQLLNFLFATILTLAALMIVLLPWFTGVAVITLIGCMVSAFVINVVGAKNAANEVEIEETRAEIQEEYEPASLKELKYLKRVARSDQDIAEAVREWIREGKTIRVRDVDAARDYLDDERVVDRRRARLLGELSQITSS